MNDTLARSDLCDVIECAAMLVDNGQQVSDEYRRGVVELATALCLGGNNIDAVTVMGYAVHGVNRPRGNETSRGNETCPYDDLRCSCAVGKGHRR